MSEQELPEVGSVWQHNETGEVRVVEPSEDFDCVDYLSSTIGTSDYDTEEDWHAWQSSATRLTPSQPLDVSRLTAAEVYRLKEELLRVDVFGAWSQTRDNCWIRPEPVMGNDFSRAYVWQCDEGYRWRIGIGVVNVPGVSSPEPFPTLSAAQAACDAVLRKAGVLLVD